MSRSPARHEESASGADAVEIGETPMTRFKDLARRLLAVSPERLRGEIVSESEAKKRIRNSKLG